MTRAETGQNRTAAARSGDDAEVRLGVIGLGRMGAMHADNAARIPGLRVVAVSDPHGPSLEAAVARLGAAGHAEWRELVERSDLDAVLICSPSSAHCDQIIAAAGTGKHIFCEKPIDLDLGRIEEALAAVERAGVTLQLGFNRRSDRNFGALRRRIAEGAIGAPWLLRITARDPAPQPAAYVRTSGGLFADMTVHDFDLARFVMGVEVAEVSAIGAALVDPALAEIPDIDCAITTLRFADGALGVIENCRQSPVGYDQRAEVHGPLGTLFAENERADTLVQADASGIHHSRIAGFLAERYDRAYLAELRAFADCLLKGEPPVATGEDGRQSAILAAAAQRSLVERRPVATSEIAG
ncbi:MAG: inositol 2-dehydrogenase [Actinobacteria bacterium]|nr:MAG: inositol 2-dehydrogenase [Actinomycetota bacterium]